MFEQSPPGFQSQLVAWAGIAKAITDDKAATNGTSSLASFLLRDIVSQPFSLFVYLPMRKHK
jgi:hypothetical protein